jgi:hypothetical protein
MNQRPLILANLISLPLSVATARRRHLRLPADERWKGDSDASRVDAIDSARLIEVTWPRPARLNAAH